MHNLLFHKVKPEMQIFVLGFFFYKRKIHVIEY